jgi:ornithine cyclodeaminase/alanine dehydrogenase-like protein (mu-crystallin family)
MIRILSEADVSALFDSHLAFAAATQAFRLLAAGEAGNGDRQRLEYGAATVNLMAAIAPSLGVMGAKAYPVVRSDVSQGASFTYQLFDYRSGALLAILSANALGNRRTAAASAVATCALARPDSEALTVVGAGWVARAQATAILDALPGIRTVRIVGRSPGREREFVAQVQEHCADRELRPIVERVDIRTGIETADVIVTATGSSTPVFDGNWIRPGTHLNAVGSNYATKRELDSVAIDRADLIVVDSLEGARRECGDLLQHPGGFPIGVVELGSVLLDQAPGRRGDDEVTLFESQGVAILDLVAAEAVVAAAAENDVGLSLDYDLAAW